MWGPFFPPDVSEQAAMVDLVQAALSGPGGAIITRRHAIEKIAPIFGIENVDAVLADIGKESAAKAQNDPDLAQITKLHGLADRLANGGTTKPGGAGAASGENPE